VSEGVDIHWSVSLSHFLCIGGQSPTPLSGVRGLEHVRALVSCCITGPQSTVIWIPFCPCLIHHDSHHIISFCRMGGVMMVGRNDNAGGGGERR
jgi:hypothetical protein